MRAPCFEAEILATSFVCAHARAGSGGNELVFAAAVGGDCHGVFSPGDDLGWTGQCKCQHLGRFVVRQFIKK